MATLAEFAKRIGVEFRRPEITEKYRFIYPFGSGNIPPHLQYFDASPEKWRDVGPRVGVELAIRDDLEQVLQPVECVRYGFFVEYDTGAVLQFCDTEADAISERRFEMDRGKRCSEVLPPIRGTVK